MGPPCEDRSELHSRPRLVNTGSALLETPSWTSMEEQLRAIGLAMHNYDSIYNGLRTKSNWFDADGKPFHSWRVYLLPYLGYENLFNQFHLNEQWDSAHNLTLLNKMPDIFRSTGDSSASTTTRLQVFSGPDALFGRDTRVYTFWNPPVQHVGPKLRDFVDGTRNTIMVAEVGLIVLYRGQHRERAL